MRRLLQNQTTLLLLTIFITLATTTTTTTTSSTIPSQSGGGRRALLSFRETPKGSNVTFDCSPSGPCIPCQYSEKNDGKYRCSETGYRIPLKCVETKDGPLKGKNAKKSQNGRSSLEMSQNDPTSHAVLNDTDPATKQRSLLDDKSDSNGAQAYITYRSCMPAVNEEKLSVLGFEVLVLGLLLVSGSFVYLRRKGTVTMSGVAPTRLQSNSRF